MEIKVRRITFKGAMMYLHALNGKALGVIDVFNKLENLGYAFLINGEVMQAGSVIGTIDDIVFLDEETDNGGV